MGQSINLNSAETKLGRLLRNAGFPWQPQTETQLMIMKPRTPDEGHCFKFLEQRVKKQGVCSCVCMCVYVHLYHHLSELVYPHLMTTIKKIQQINHDDHDVSASIP